MDNPQTNEHSAPRQKLFKQKLLELLFHGVACIAVLVVLLPGALYPLTPAFTGKALASIIFTLACVERIWSMYLRRGLACACSGAGRDWTAIAVGYAYALTLGGAVTEFSLRGRLPGWGYIAVGALCYTAGVALRYWAFHALRHQWNVDVSNTNGERYLVREGPYRLMRHPLYCGACLEILGLPLFLGAGWALLFGAICFMPLEVTRAYYEESFLRTLFGPAYQTYKNEVWGFFPLPFRPRSQR